MGAGCARGTRNSRLGGAPRATSGRPGRRSPRPHATPPQPRPATRALRARRRADRRSGKRGRCSRQSVTTGGRSRRTTTPRRRRHRRRAPPVQPFPSSRSGRRARTPPSPAWSAGGPVLAGRRRRLGRHVCAVGLLQVGDLTGTGLCCHRWQRRVALCARRGRVARRSAAADELPHSPRRCGRGQRPTCLRAHPATLEPPGFVGHRARPNHRCGELLAGVTTYGPEQRARIKTVRAQPRLFVSQQFSAKPWATRRESWEKSDDDHAASKRHRK